MDEPVTHRCSANLQLAFRILGKRWNGLILDSLQPGPLGFSDLRRSVGAITDSVLSDRLGELAEVGLVRRRVTDTRPPGVQYELTAGGAAVIPVLDQLGDWAAEHLDTSSCGNAGDAADSPEAAASAV